MDRYETDLVTDAKGDVVLHVGVAGVRVHVVAEIAAGAPATPPDQAWLSAVGAWKDYEFQRPAELVQSPIDAIWPETAR